MPYGYVRSATSWDVWLVRWVNICHPRLNPQIRRWVYKQSACLSNLSSGLHAHAPGASSGRIETVYSAARATDPGNMSGRYIKFGGRSYKSVSKNDSSSPSSKRQAASRFSAGLWRAHEQFPFSFAGFAMDAQWHTLRIIVVSSTKCNMRIHNSRAPSFAPHTEASRHPNRLCVKFILLLFPLLDTFMIPRKQYLWHTVLFPSPC